MLLTSTAQELEESCPKQNSAGFLLTDIVNLEVQPEKNA